MNRYKKWNMRVKNLMNLLTSYWSFSPSPIPKSFKKRSNSTIKSLSISETEILGQKFFNLLLRTQYLYRVSSLSLVFC